MDCTEGKLHIFSGMNTQKLRNSIAHFSVWNINRAATINQGVHGAA